MEMQMGNGLACIRTAVGDDAEAAGKGRFGSGDLADGEKAGCDFIIAQLIDFRHGRNMLLWDDEHMERRLWIDILKSKNLIVFKHFGGGNFAFDDFAEETVIHDGSFLSMIFYHHSAEKLRRDRLDCDPDRNALPAVGAGREADAQVFRRIAFPTAIHHFLRKKEGGPADPSALVAERCFPADTDQPAGTVLLDSIGELAGHIRSYGAGAGRIGKNMDPGKADLPDHGFRFGVFLFRFAGETGQDIRGESGIREKSPEVFYGFQETGGQVLPPHAAQDAVAAGLQGQMELGADFPKGSEPFGELRRRNIWLQGTETDTKDTVRFLQDLQDIQQAASGRQILPVGRNQNAGQDNLTEAGGCQPGGFRTDIFQGAGPDGTADRGDDTVGTAVTAAFLDFQDGTGALPEIRNMQRFVGHVIREWLHGTAGTAGGHHFLQEGNNTAAELGANDKIRAGGKKLFTAQLSQAATEHQGAARMLPLQAASQLKTFLIACTGDGAGIDQIDIRGGGKRNGLKTGGGEQFLHGPGIILIDLASKRMIGNGGHDQLLHFPI